MICEFELVDVNQNISQRFVVGPRFYQSNESNGSGDGIYEFHPKNNYSEPYSELKSVKINKEQFSGQFLLIYDDDVSENQKDRFETTGSAKLTATVELSSYSDFVKFSVILEAIPITRKSMVELKDGDVLRLSKELGGKNVVLNWEFLDGFDTN